MLVVRIVPIGRSRIPLEQACLLVLHSIIEKFVAPIGGVEGISNGDNWRLNRLRRNMDFPSKAFVMPLMKLPPVLPRLLRNPAVLI